MLGRLERYRVYTGEEYKINQAGRGGDIYVIIFCGVRLPNAPKNKTKMAARKLYFRRLRSCVRDWIGYENHTASKET